MLDVRKLNDLHFINSQMKKPLSRHKKIFIFVLKITFMNLKTYGLTG